MFNATHFTYDGVFSGTYGLLIADFDDSSVVETSAFSPSLNTNKPSKINRFFHNGIVYEAAPQHQFSIISEQPINELVRREILSWLVGRDSYKVLEIHQPDLEDYEYRCVFTNTEIIYVHGECHGFRLTANFDSIYQHGRPSVLSVSGTGVEKTVTIMNNSDIKDDYVYPMVYFKSSAAVNGNNIFITNITDDSQRHFIFKGLYDNEEVTVDNELKHISSSRAGEKLSAFNKNWLRLRPGVNRLKITINGTVKITCPTYVMLGF